MTKRLGSYTHEYSERDLALYALGLGCGVADLPFVYECHPDFAALPTFAVIPAHPVAMFVPLEGYIPSYDRVRGTGRGKGAVGCMREPHQQLWHLKASAHFAACFAHRPRRCMGSSI